MKNHRCFYAAFLSVAFCVALNAADAQAPKADKQSAARYVVRKTIPIATPFLRNTGSGRIALVASRLELMTDNRVKPGMSDAETTNFLPAKIRLVGDDGALQQEKTLERSRATLEAAPPLYGKNERSTYLLTVDYSADMGSYNGPITFLLEVNEGQFQFVTAQNKPIALMRSLKTDWKFMPARSSGGKTLDILEVACRPNTAAKLSDNNTDNDFVVMYRRFHFNGRGWTKREKSWLGFWEDDGKFPPISLFPTPVL